MLAKSFLFILPLIAASQLSHAAPYFHGEPEFADDPARTLAGQMLEAHGGMAAWQAADAFRFKFFTHMVNAPRPFLSDETIDLESGAAYMDWLLFDGVTAWDGETAWSVNWPMPISAGFFVRLSATFITLPWQVFADEARIASDGQAALAGEDGMYDVLRVTYDAPTPSLPGTYYRLFIDPESRLLRAVEFDIAHPGMVANPNQPLGPNLHVFGEYRQVGELIFPTFYETIGQGSAKGGAQTAYHFAWDIDLGASFDHGRLKQPENAVVDTSSMQWWNR